MQKAEIREDIEKVKALLREIRHHEEKGDAGLTSAQMDVLFSTIERQEKEVKILRDLLNLQFLNLGEDDYAAGFEDGTEFKAQEQADSRQVKGWLIVNRNNGDYLFSIRKPSSVAIHETVMAMYGEPRY